VDHAYLLSIVRYNRRTGLFTSLINRKKVKVGDVIGSVSVNGYCRTTIDGQFYLLHRLAWFYAHGQWPSKSLDHRNGIKTDNRILNLREADAVENGRNRRLAKTNRTGVSGVHFINGRFRVDIKLRDRRLNLGTFDTLREAKQVRRGAERRHFGEFRPNV
jgi:hypothetical protein